MINEVNLDSVEKLLIMDLFLKNPTATRRSYACAISLPTAVLLFIIYYYTQNFNRSGNNFPESMFSALTCLRLFAAYKL